MRHDSCTSSEGEQPRKAGGEGGSETECGGDSGGVTSPALQMPAAGAKSARPFHESACVGGSTRIVPRVTHAFMTDESLSSVRGWCQKHRSDDAPHRLIAGERHWTKPMAPCSSGACRPHDGEQCRPAQRLLYLDCCCCGSLALDHGHEVGHRHHQFQRRRCCRAGTVPRPTHLMRKSILVITSALYRASR